MLIFKFLSMFSEAEVTWRFCAKSELLPLHEKRVRIFTLQRVHDARSLEATYFIDH